MPSQLHKQCGSVGQQLASMTAMRTTITRHNVAVDLSFRCCTCGTLQALEKAKPRDSQLREVYRAFDTRGK